MGMSECPLKLPFVPLGDFVSEVGIAPSRSLLLRYLHRLCYLGWAVKFTARLLLGARVAHPSDAGADKFGELVWVPDALARRASAAAPAGVGASATDPPPPVEVVLAREVDEASPPDAAVEGGVVEGGMAAGGGALLSEAGLALADLDPALDLLRAQLVAWEARRPALRRGGAGGAGGRGGGGSAPMASSAAAAAAAAAAASASAPTRAPLFWAADAVDPWSPHAGFVFTNEHLRALGVDNLAAAAAFLQQEQQQEEQQQQQQQEEQQGQGSGAAARSPPQPVPHLPRHLLTRAQALLRREQNPEAAAAGLGGTSPRKRKPDHRRPAKAVAVEAPVVASAAADGEGGGGSTPPAPPPPPPPAPSPSPALPPPADRLVLVRVCGSWSPRSGQAEELVEEEEEGEEVRRRRRWAAEEDEARGRRRAFAGCGAATCCRSRRVRALVTEVKVTETPSPSLGACRCGWPTLSRPSGGCRGRGGELPRAPASSSTPGTAAATCCSLAAVATGPALSSARCARLPKMSVGVGVVSRLCRSSSSQRSRSSRGVGRREALAAVGALGRHPRSCARGARGGGRDFGTVVSCAHHRLGDVVV